MSDAFYTAAVYPADGNDPHTIPIERGISYPLSHSDLSLKIPTLLGLVSTVGRGRYCQCEAARFASMPAPNGQAPSRFRSNDQELCSVIAYKRA